MDNIDLSGNGAAALPGLRLSATAVSVEKLADTVLSKLDSENLV